MYKPVRKAVFPVAGLGTRFLPATKAMPKEMLPVVDKPLIHYAVEEAKAAGIEEFFFVTSRGKSAIDDHFDRAFELEATLRERGKTALLNELEARLPEPGQMAYTRQQIPLGLGHAVWCARWLVGDEPFAVLLADDLIDAQRPVIGQMADRYAKDPYSLLGVQDIPREQTDQYGIVAIDAKSGDPARITAIVEKPKPQAAPSTLAVVGRYILSPRVFHHLEKLQSGAGGEIQLTDAIAALLAEEKVVAYRFEGRRYDCGSKLGYLQATVDFGARHPEVGKAFTAFLKSR
jgi:UTP--glucose-1-phosphate uridylyltransferase